MRGDGDILMLLQPALTPHLPANTEHPVLVDFGTQTCPLEPGVTAQGTQHIAVVLAAPLASALLLLSDLRLPNITRMRYCVQVAVRQARLRAGTALRPLPRFAQGISKAIVRHVQCYDYARLTCLVL